MDEPDAYSGSQLRFPPLAPRPQFSPSHNRSILIHGELSGLGQKPLTYTKRLSISLFQDVTTAIGGPPASTTAEFAQADCHTRRNTDYSEIYQDSSAAARIIRAGGTADCNINKHHVSFFSFYLMGVDSIIKPIDFQSPNRSQYQRGGFRAKTKALGVYAEISKSIA